MSEIDMGLYDSATGASIKAIKVVDVTDMQHGHEKALLVFAEAERGRLVQLRLDALHVHYFFDEPVGRQMITEDEPRFGFRRLVQTIIANAPPSGQGGAE
jgi:hypothetical protein